MKDNSPNAITSIATGNESEKEKSEMKPKRERQSIWNKEISRERLQKENQAYLIGNMAKIRQLKQLIETSHQMNECQHDDIFMNKERQKCYLFLF